MADLAGKAALNKSVTPLLIPYSDYKASSRIYIRDLMQKWDTQADEMILCDYCGDDISPTTNGHKQSDNIFHQDCFNDHIPRGEHALALFRKNSSQSNVFLTAIHISYLNGLKGENAEQRKQKRVKRDSKVRELLKEVTALRNSTSGQILIHLVGRDHQDTFSGAFDEFIDEKLLGLIHDGSLFTDVYTKQPMCAYGKVLQQLKLEKEEALHVLRQSQQEDIDQLETLIEQNQLELEAIEQELQQEEVAQFLSFTDIIVLSVEGGDYLTTTDFKTKIALDDRIINPSDQTVLTCLRKKKHFHEVFHCKELNRDLQDLQESRSVQFKGYYPKPNSSDRDILDFMFKDHKLLEYASAFTKNDRGGSYFVGIAESDVYFASNFYRSKVYINQPVEVINCEQLVADIKRTFEETVLVCDYNGNQRHDLDLVKVEFLHSLPHCGADRAPITAGGHFVIHVHIKPVSGIAFYDSQGPLAYRIVNNAVTTYTVKEWFRAINVSSSLAP